METNSRERSNPQLRNHSESSGKSQTGPEETSESRTVIRCGCELEPCLVTLREHGERLDTTYLKGVISDGGNEY